MMDELASLTDEDAVRLFGFTFRRELQHLKFAAGTVESGKSQPGGNLGARCDTPSRFLYGEDFIEINRTLVSMLALKWLLADDYKAFTRCQSGPARLTRDSFGKLRKFFQDRLRNTEDIYLLLVITAIEDAGKDRHLAREVEERTGVSMSNHDEVVFSAAQAGMLPALRKLSVDKHDDVLLALQLGSKLNIAQLAQAENVPGNLTVLADFKENTRVFNIKTMQIILDVAGAGGHVDPRGCLPMIDPVFRSYMTTISALTDFVNGKVSSERECYDLVLTAKARDLDQSGFPSLSVTNREERALLRLLTIGRVADGRRADRFKQAFDQLSASSRQALVNGLNVDGFAGDVAIIPYYAPGLLAEALRNTQDTTDPSLIKALSAFMRFLARVLAGAKSAVGAPAIIIERDLSFAQGIIKGPDFRSDPSILDDIVLPWKR
jgi:hypothetical protein